LGALIYRDLQREESISGRAACVGEGELKDVLRVYAYGTPSCVDAKLADDVAPFVTTAVLHDDAVPRLTPASCRGLLKHLLHIRETWVKDHLPDDLNAITARARTVWAPKWRGSFTLSQSSASSIKKYCRKQLQYGKRKLLYVKEKISRDECVDPTALCGGGRGDMLETVDERSEELIEESTVSLLKGEKISIETDLIEKSDPETDPSGPRLLLDYMGGIDGRTECVVIDGDEFFDPSDNLLEGSDCDSEEGAELNEALFKSGMGLEEAGDITTETAGQAAVCDEAPEPTYDDSDSDSVEDSPGAVVLEEIPLPRMFIPGKVVHIYSHRGVYRAAFVPKTFRELRRISLAGNMLSDHRTKSYYEALLEVQSVRQAPEFPPRWTAFDEDDTWYVGF